MDLVLVSLASFLAGTIDSIVGGGGLVLLPALFAAFPAAPPATLLGTNKSASIWGTAMATWQYSRRVQIDWRLLRPAILTALGCSFLGAWAVTQIDPTYLRRSLPFILALVLGYTLWRKELGRTHAPRHRQGRATLIACAIAGVVGFYDGFFGPGTGSFFIFLLVRFLGYDFLNASVSAKVLNVSTNAAALVLFAAKGHIWWQLGLTMAVANVAGSLLGARLALRHGPGFVRVVFVLVVSALIVKTGLDAFGGAAG